MSDLRKAAERLLHGNRQAIQSDDFNEVIRNCQQHNTDCDEVAKAFLEQASELDRLAAENEHLKTMRSRSYVMLKDDYDGQVELTARLEQQVAALRSAAEEALSELRAVDDHSSTGNASVRKAISRLSAAISGKTE